MELTNSFRPSKQQVEALKVLEETNDSVFIYGRAGSGKTTFIEYFRKNTKKNFVTLTFTGLAAVLIKGQTIHSFFQFPPRTLLKEDPDVKVLSKRIAQIKSLDILFIDEISTVSCDVLHSIDSVLREYRDVNKPFGGIQIAFVGDIFQIAPVPPKGMNENQAFANDYKSIWFFDCEGYIELNPTFIQFEWIHRHLDKGFRDKLEAIRRNDINANTLNYFNEKVNVTIPPSSIALCATNAQVDNYNINYMDQIDHKEIKFIGESKNFKESEMPTDKELVLKKSARIMILKNDSQDRWVNGTFAVITELTPSSIKIKTILSNGKYSKEYEILQDKWEKYDYQLVKDEDAKKDRYKPVVIGYFKQYPIRVARATTIHKSQGQTFDNVLVDFGSRGAFAHGQAYVALTRVKLHEGLFLKVPLKESDVRFDPRVINFYKQHFTDTLFDKPNGSGPTETIVPF